MFALEHQVRVFVFQILRGRSEFLLLQHEPAAEWPLGPVVGPVQHDENIRGAVVRQVRAETGITKPAHLIDLSQPAKQLFGEVGLVEWPFAYQAGTPGHPVEKILPGPQIGEITWMGFEEAFQRIETDEDRDNLVRLQLALQS